MLFYIANLMILGGIVFILLTSFIEAGSITLNREAAKSIKNGNRILLPLGIVLVIASGIYIVPAQSQSLEFTFGKLTAVKESGPKFIFPYIQTKTIVDVTSINRKEIGFRTAEGGFAEVEEEAQMFTADENIVLAEGVLQYKIKDLKAFWFNIKDKDAIIRDVTQASMRQVIGSKTLDEVLTSGKSLIQQEIRDLIQGRFDKYNAGLHVTEFQLQDVQPPKEVIEAFKSVQSAKETKVRLENEALGYANSIIPVAQGEAQKIINEANGYRAARIATAQGDASNFNLIYAKYKDGPEITKKRLYYETMEKVFPNTKKIIVDEKFKGQIINIIGKSDNIVPVQTNSDSADQKGGN